MYRCNCRFGGIWGFAACSGYTARYYIYYVDILYHLYVI